MTTALLDQPTSVPAARPPRPRWVRPSTAGLLAGTAVLYLWGLSANGYGNDFYAAAVQAGSQSWKAFFFGSLDAGNAITVDKTPASLWVMELSVRLFGLNPWALLVPQALMGVGTVALVVAAVRRTTGRPGAALVGGAVMALTPVAVLMFRYDNPDALLVLLLTAAGYALVRALQSPRALRWMVLAGALVGVAFLAKMLQAFLVLPGFALVYLVLAEGALRRRFGHLLAAGAAMLVAGGWWVAVVQLWPADSRPYVGGSTDDSVLELALGYNGISRLSGGEGGPQTGTPGLLRLVGADLGGQVAWFLPAALVALVAGLVWTARRPRTDPVRAGLLVWGGWLLVTGLVFSLMAGTFHGYYTVALAPAIAALVGIGVALVGDRPRTGPPVLAATVALTAVWSFVLLGRSAEFLPWLRWVVLVGGLLAAAGLLVGRFGAGLRRGAVVVALLAALAGPAAYSVQTVATAHTGSIPTAGPTVSGGTSGFGGGRGGGGAPSGGFPGRPDGADGATPGGGATGLPGGTDGGTDGDAAGAPGGAAGGGQGGFGGGSASEQVVALLQQDAGSYRWAAATVGSQTSAVYQLVSGDPVMAIGGFTGSDPSPTLAQFQAYVAAGDVHWFIGAGQGRGGDGSASEITQWVAATCTAQTVDGVTVYDLTAPAS
ncbi:4-amino-4-deoxy-L-arabinose transferase [Klenkia soli]|uniref:4-amino-4-deoxy-L-arabinose transferase n=1 Tax=Klenkia soli TaxID=1052260 RepID=A0A1H0TDA2_9ACTN|nr:glycosyltransferase family 39 protein [Klenkia soli]SDP52022.1 4-amino-4-deoxy-L-arabinose transferase [Klenkia soli]